MIVFKPAGKIGFIQPSIEDNELFEEDNVDYMNAGNGIRIANGVLVNLQGKGW